MLHFRPMLRLAALASLVMMLVLLMTGGQKEAIRAAEGADLMAQGLNAPTNIACLPFPQPTITEYNGQKISGPYTSDTTSSFISWRDESASEDSYVVERQPNGGEWEEVATLAADSISYQENVPDANEIYRYRVSALQGDQNQTSAVCRKPSWVDSSDGNFRVFYRPTDCPDVQDLDNNPDTMCSLFSTAQRIADTLEASRDAILSPTADEGNFTFLEPITDAPLAVDLTLCDGAGCARTNNNTSFLTLRPASMELAFNPVTGEGQNSVKVPLHEVFHRVQRGLTDPARKWVSEGQARSIEDKFCLDMPAYYADCATMDQQPDSVYLWRVGTYLADTNIKLTEAEYKAALFWTYITEQYGTLTEEPELGLDFMILFWERANAVAHTNGRQVIDETLDKMGYSATFRDVFKDFAVATYAKDIPNAPAKYKYIDEAQSTGSYGTPTLAMDVALTQGQQVLNDSAFVVPWGVQYFRFVPDASVPTLDIESKTFTGNDLYYTLLAVKGGNIVEEVNYTGDHFVDALNNDNFDEVVLVVAGLEEGSNFNLSVNATQPVLRILDPLANRPAQAGDPTTPEKVLLKVEVLSPEEGGTPIPGLDPYDFTITVGTEVVTDSQLISSAYIQGQYWMIVRAPQQAMTGAYDLLVTHEMLSDTVPSAIIYDMAIESDNLIVADRSGSMDDFPGKLEAAQDASRLYVDSWDTGDQFGVLSYNEFTTVDLSLRAWNDSSRDDAFDEINAWVADGGTGIGNALLTGLTELDDDGDASHPWNMMLLSDGIETVEEPNLEDFVDEYNTRKDDGDPVPRIHVVALGPDADQKAMEALASSTGGTYHFAGESIGGLAPLGGGILNNELAEIYRVVGETITLQQQIYAQQDILLPGGLDIHPVQVDGSASEAIFTFNWVPNGISPTTLRLKRPDGTFEGVAHLFDARHVMWRIPAPMPGEWEMRIGHTIPGNASESATAGLNAAYLAEAALRSDIKMDVFLGLPVTERLLGKPMPIFVSLSDSQPLTGATVTAQITDPTGIVSTITLHDDGQHGDGAAADGFYGRTFYQTSKEGSYQVLVTGEGTSPLNGEFKRRLRTSFYLADDNDRDEDRLPDWWEEEHGTDPDVPDAEDDPDKDKLNNANEFQWGTHPLDPDTDNGGEGDGSEVFGGADPHEPDDDQLEPPTSVAWSGAAQVWISFTAEATYNTLQVYRAEGTQGSYELVADNVEPTGEWIDESVSNDIEYCYRLVATDATGATSGSTNAICTTPKSDPNPPLGDVEINGGAASSSTPTVELTLQASDSPADVEYIEPDEPPTSDGATISGVSDMMISNRADFTDAEWEPYQRTKSWTLEPIKGVASIFAKFRDAAGNESDITFDGIHIIEDEGYSLYLPTIIR